MPVSVQKYINEQIDVLERLEQETAIKQQNSDEDEELPVVVRKKRSVFQHPSQQQFFEKVKDLIKL